MEYRTAGRICRESRERLTLKRATVARTERSNKPTRQGARGARRIGAMEVAMRSSCRPPRSSTRRCETVTQGSEHTGQRVPRGRSLLRNQLNLGQYSADVARAGQDHFCGFSGLLTSSRHPRTGVAFGGRVNGTSRPCSLAERAACEPIIRKEDGFEIQNINLNR